MQGLKYTSEKKSDSDGQQVYQTAIAANERSNGLLQTVTTLASTCLFQAFAASSPGKANDLRRTVSDSRSSEFFIASAENHPSKLGNSKVQSLTSDLGPQSLILTVTMHANLLVQAERCTIYIVDERKQELWSLSTDTGAEIRIPIHSGFAPGQQRVQIRAREP